MAKKKQRSEEYGRKEAAWWADFERAYGEQPLEKKLWVAWRKGFESCQRDEGRDQAPARRAEAD